MKQIKIEKRTITHTQKDKSSSLGFEIKRIKELKQHADSYGKLHKHDFYYILFLTNGSSNQTIDFKTEKIEQSQVLFMYPGQIHGFEYFEKTEGFTLYFTNGFLNKSESSSYKIHQLIINQPQIITLDNQQFENIDQIINKLYNEFNTSFVNKIEILKAYLEIVLTSLLRLIIPSDYEFQPSNTFQRLIDLKEQNFALNRKIDSICKDIGTSQKKLNALTKAYFGKTFLKLLNDRKLLEVKRLLTTSELSIKEISYQNGFSDNSHLNNFFKKHTGITPFEFREKYS